MKIKVVDTSVNKLPAYETNGSAGMDLRSNIIHLVVLAPGERVLVPTGLRIQLPKGYEAQVRPRSGLALKHGVTVLNSPGTIDSDYTGDIGVILINQGKEHFHISHGDRIAQLVFNKVEQAEWEEVEELSETERGEGGFGSTGVKDTSSDLTNKEVLLTEEYESLKNKEIEELHKNYLSSISESKREVLKTAERFSPLVEESESEEQEALMRYYAEVSEEKKREKDIAIMHYLSEKQLTIPQYDKNFDGLDYAATRFIDSLLEENLISPQAQLEVREKYIEHRRLEGTESLEERQKECNNDSAIFKHFSYVFSTIDIFNEDDDIRIKRNKIYENIAVDENGKIEIIDEKGVIFVLGISESKFFIKLEYDGNDLLAIPKKELIKQDNRYIHYAHDLKRKLDEIYNKFAEVNWKLK